MLKISFASDEFEFSRDGLKLDTFNYASEITALRIELHEDYFSDVRALLQSAYDSLMSAVSSSLVNRELTDVINHLSQAFDTLNSLLTKTKKEKFLLLFSFTTNLVDDKSRVYKLCLSLCLMLHDLYCILNDFDKVSVWYTSASEYLQLIITDFKDKHGDYSITPYGEDDPEIDMKQYNQLIKISNSYGHMYTWTESKHVGWAEYGEITSDRTHVKYYMTEKGREYCKYHEDLIINRAKKALNKSIEFLQLSEIELKKYRLSRLAEEAYARNNYMEAAKRKYEIAKICRTQKKEEDAYILECSANEYFELAYHKKYWYYYYSSDFKERFEFINEIPVITIREKLLKELDEQALKGNDYTNVAVIKSELAKICRKQGKTKEAHLLDSLAEEYKHKE